MNTRLYKFQFLDESGQPVGSPRLIEAQSDAIATKYGSAGRVSCSVATAADAARMAQAGVLVEVVPTPKAKKAAAAAETPPPATTGPGGDLGGASGTGETSEPAAVEPPAPVVHKRKR